MHSKRKSISNDIAFPDHDFAICHIFNLKNVKENRIYDTLVITTPFLKKKKNKRATFKC